MWKRSYGSELYNTKHLKFGPSKCYRIHVGPKADGKCSLVKVHDSKMKEAKSQKYLGQVIASDGKNDLDFEERYHKGMGGANQIISILQAAAFNKQYFQTAMLF